MTSPVSLFIHYHVDTFPNKWQILAFAEVMALEYKGEDQLSYLPIQNMLVPQVGHTPFVAGLPFFIVTALALFISFLDLHFIQYASIFFLPFFGC